MDDINTKKEQLQTIKDALAAIQAEMNGFVLADDGTLWFSVEGRSVSNEERADAELAKVINVVINSITSLIDIADA